MRFFIMQLDYEPEISDRVRVDEVAPRVNYHASINTSINLNRKQGPPFDNNGRFRLLRHSLCATE